MIARLLFVVLSCVAMLVPAQGSALSLSPGPELILNWDFTGATPPPPYTSVAIDLMLEVPPVPCCLPAPTFTARLYNDVDGGGGVLTTATFFDLDNQAPAQAVVQFLANSDCCPTIFDGMFSVGITVERPDTELLSATATATIETGLSTGAVPGTVLTAVPEPSMLTLLGTGIVALGVFRHRRDRSPAASRAPRRSHLRT